MSFSVSCCDEKAMEEVQAEIDGVLDVISKTAKGDTVRYETRLDQDSEVAFLKALQERRQEISITAAYCYDDEDRGPSWFSVYKYGTEQRGGKKVLECRGGSSGWY